MMGMCEARSAYTKRHGYRLSLVTMFSESVPSVKDRTANIVRKVVNFSSMPFRAYSPWFPQFPYFSFIYPSNLMFSESDQVKNTE